MEPTAANLLGPKQYCADGIIYERRVDITRDILGSITKRKDAIFMNNAINPVHEKIVEFEIARDTLSNMSAMYVSKIYKEEKKDQPDKSLIAEWDVQATDFMKQRSLMDMDDTAKIKEIDETYSPIIKKWFQETEEETEGTKERTEKYRALTDAQKDNIYQEYARQVR